MFTTFVGIAPRDVKSSTHLSPEIPSPPKRRQKRSQVARACDWCRTHRIKCDNHLPCSNCRKRKGQCSQGEIEIRTLPHAYRKIEELEKRVRELEQELEKERGAKRSAIGLETPHGSPSSATCHSGPESALALSPSSHHGSGTGRKKSGEGVRIRTARSRQETWYGPSSLFYFIRRVNTFLNDSLRQTQPITRMLPDSNKLFDGPTQNPAKDHGHRLISTPGKDQTATGDYLTPTQEEYFIGLFWQSFQTSLPVLDEVAFKEHYQSLWTASGRERKPSALVDIVIALCMQYGVAQEPGIGSTSSAAASTRSEKDGLNASVAGRWYYQRCQNLLTNELESPTIYTLQCHILSTTYLCAGSFPNMADSTCTLAVRTAYMLGLHLDPPEETPLRERELRKRLWWTLYVFDSKISMKLGRPFLLEHSDTTCSLPRDDQEIATLSGSVFTPLGESITWLTFHVENIKLLLAVRAAYTAFYKKQLGAADASDGQSSRDILDIIETHAEFLGPYLSRIEEWVKGVPNALQTKRREDGVPFSTDFSSLEIKPFASLWLQRQRMLLELMYHNLCINLFRPFIRFNPAKMPTPTADKLATRCAAHAITLTRIMHQALSSTSILTGWHESFQWQWNATMTLIGFAIAYPQHAPAPEARHAIGLSVTTFEIFARSLPTATSAATIARDLSSQIDVLTKQTQEKYKHDSTQWKAEDVPPSPASWRLTGSGPRDGDVTGGDPNLDISTFPGTAAGTWSSDTTPMWAESIDMAFAVDTQDFGMLYWPDVSNDLTTQWTYPELQM
ncbi:fungal-specific transcription factor domain-containing protein [Hypoxylon sp. NC0597]|nr:fungal-specific transcription factor domain-containing protein [Hypoxylon sp. NC0597]